MCLADALTPGAAGLPAVAVAAEGGGWLPPGRRARTGAVGSTEVPLKPPDSEPAAAEPSLVPGGAGVSGLTAEVLAGRRGARRRRGRSAGPLAGATAASSGADAGGDCGEGVFSGAKRFGSNSVGSWLNGVAAAGRDAATAAAGAGVATRAAGGVVDDGSGLAASCSPPTCGAAAVPALSLWDDCAPAIAAVAAPGVGASSSTACSASTSGPTGSRPPRPRPPRRRRRRAGAAPPSPCS